MSLFLFVGGFALGLKKSKEHCNNDFGSEVFVTLGYGFTGPVSVPVFLMSKARKRHKIQKSNQKIEKEFMNQPREKLTNQRVENEIVEAELRRLFQMEPCEWNIWNSDNSDDEEGGTR